MFHNVVATRHVGSNDRPAGAGRFKQGARWTFAVRRKYNAVGLCDVAPDIISGAEVFNDAGIVPFVDHFRLDAALMFRVFGPKQLEPRVKSLFSQYPYGID